ncbi:copper chaperone PCu(A)C [Paragemmobacter straminiformis]|uniref:Copper chaperone PCu(A)C n=1 Tax=Paragemmobacter straminiformis TaxID=2045119 RepID=A0A842I3T1_9RHOB|nr:copper chaperone PCu(A)C [Gemmobacter straminiformis]MBC2834251.1 copper chaperone PCu(A)C [Gemmobacter straminiformis]
MSFRSLIAAAALAVLPLAATAQTHPEEMHVHDAYARIGNGSGAVFFMIHNNTDVDRTIVGAHTDIADKAELHSHTEGADGVMVMGKIEGGVALPSGEMHEFARGGDHVMLMGLKRALADGDQFDLVLEFADGAELTLPVVVDNGRKAGEMDMTEHSGHMTKKGASD